MDTPTAPRSRLERLVLERGHPLDLPAECHAEARQWLSQPGLDDPALHDLRTLPLCTIDYETSQDLDQALFVRPMGAGFEVLYAIADAAHYIRPGSTLFEEALRRGATMYLPNLTLPMLPLTLSEGLISLNERVDRRALVFRMEVDATGRCARTEILRGLIHSHAKLDYDGVQRWLDGGPEPTDDPGVLESLRALADFGELRMREAESRDVVRIRRAEVDVRIDGLRFQAMSAARNDVERYSEQLSLMANIEGARILQQGQDHPDVHPVFRTHAPPDDASLRELAEQIRTLVTLHELPQDWLWTPGGAESLANYLRRLPADHGAARAIQRQALFTSGRSGFSPTPAAHHGVGADVYARFTAPMREVVGVFVHKELWELLGASPTDKRIDRALQQQVIQAAERSRREQRALTKLVNRMALDALFRGDVGEPRWHSAWVMGVTGGKIHVQLDDPAIDVKVYVMDLERKLGGRCAAKNGLLYRKDDGQRVLALGDRVRLRVAGLDDARDRWIFELEVAD